jgi:hypothetical protein
MEKSAHHPGGNTHEHHASRHWRSHFVEHLAETSSVAAAAAHAGVSVARACKTRCDEPEFARQWLRALAEGYLHLEMEILRRLREGDFKASDTERYDFVNAIRLLAAHKDNVAGIQGRIREVSAAEVRASIDRKIEDIRRRLAHSRAAEPQVT